MTDQNQKAILDIFHQYHTIVKGFIVTLEIDDGEYPVEILNEIRALMNHLAKCYIADDEKSDDYLVIIDRNINNAKSHLRRAIFDCYKYGCLSVDDLYNRLQYNMRNVDLGVIDNGEFAIGLSNQYTKAKEAFKQARMAEQNALDSTLPDSIYEAYQSAYEEYDCVRTHIEKKSVEIQKARHKQQKRYVINNIFGWAGIIGMIWGIVAFIFR